MSRQHLEEALQDITPAATRADGDLARRAPHGLLDVAAHATVRSYLKRFLRSGAPGATRSVLLVPDCAQINQWRRVERFSTNAP